MRRVCRRPLQARLDEINFGRIAGSQVRGEIKRVFCARVCLGAGVCLGVCLTFFSNRELYLLWTWVRLTRSLLTLSVVRVTCYCKAELRHDGGKYERLPIKVCLRRTPIKSPPKAYGQIYKGATVCAVWSTFTVHGAYLTVKLLG